MEQNETAFQVPQAPVLCVNNCRFFGTVATMNICSKCYKDLCLKPEQAKLAAAQTVSLDTTIAPSGQASVALPTTEVTKEIKDGPKRCGCCRKRVGLTGFNCRCGGTFCSIHRHSDKHECSYDYRSAGQEAIAKANPLIKAEKLDKI